ncbi:choice-of-anchor I family protein [Hymenobacter sp. BT190]|uniref:choice-of-anchor I family protein n=1 Tax=Hymenobacter sp. BT190 TaxID=2763505 RepID=UPI0016514375|nr:choice-of-anchor I family protein [Hymenobacter sp. BT190]MBC6698419.1 choice-of-anchor I family protein [Hymenobacter sp. BT190]
MRLHFYVFPVLACLAAAPHATHAQTLPTITRPAATTVVAENAGSVSLTFTLQNPNTSSSSVEVAVQALSTASAGTDYVLPALQTLTFPAGTTSQTITVPLTDDQLAEETEYFVLRLQNPTNATLTAGATDLLVYVRDNDTPAPALARSLSLTLNQSFQTATPFSGTTQINSAEIAAYDPSTRRLYVANSIGGRLDILSLSPSAVLSSVASIDIRTYGNINSVAVRNGIVACAIEGTDPQQNGKVVFLNQDGVLLQQVAVGAMPDMITFTPDGRTVLTANEGEPKADYSVDPEGSVSLIDVSGGIPGLTQAQVTTVGFTSFNGQAAQLRGQGIRIYGGLAAAPATVAQDLEPEYIALSADSRTAYITLQENNALAVLDLPSRQITALRPLGTSDHRQAGRGLDASDQTPEVLVANWPIKGLRLPDAIASFEAAGTPYLLTANEGDARDYTGFSEQVRLGTTSTTAPYVLDPTVFPNAALLKNNAVLGRLNVTNRLGDTDGDGDFDEIYAYGGRSFSIYQANTGALVHDSGNLLERLTSTDGTYGAIFNASNSFGEAPTRKNRSDDKGPEPEGVTTGRVGNTLYGFVTLERVGGVAVVNLTDPANPALEAYANNRGLTAGTGDLGPEGILFVSAADSPSGQPLVLLANEVSSSISVYRLAPSVPASTRGGAVAAAALYSYPNPSRGSATHLSRPITGTLFDLAGRAVQQLRSTDVLPTAGLAPGLYLLRATDGGTARIAVE